MQFRLVIMIDSSPADRGGKQRHQPLLPLPIPDRGETFDVGEVINIEGVPVGQFS